MAFENDILVGFQPKFKSIDRDCDRYSDILFKQHENGDFDAKKFLDLSAAGSLWITEQYIDQGLFELVEIDLRATIINRDTYGPLHPQILAIFERLLYASQNDRVIAMYVDAIKHRLRYATSKSSPPKFRKFYLPALREMIADFEILLVRLNSDQGVIKDFQKSLSQVQ
jgi:hypothetical protein